MKCIVIGAGAWGLPAAFELQRQGHTVTLVERFEPGNPYASSGGDTRLWRLADTQPWRARALAQSVSALERLSARLEAQIFRRTGLLWRDDESLPQVSESLRSIDAEFQEVNAADVGSVFPGLQPDARDALFVPEAGVVLVDVLLRRLLEAFLSVGGTYLPDSHVTGLKLGDGHATVTAGSTTLTAEQVLVCAGPGTRELLGDLGVDLPLRPYVEQVVYFGDPNLPEPAPDLPGMVDVPTADEPGIYAMSAGPRGYKIGLDMPLRSLVGDELGNDLDRTLSADRSETLRQRVERDFRAVSPRVLSAQVCTWTDSGDGDFIVERIHPSVVLACGDSGEGFKFSAFMGEYLASLIQGRDGDPEFQHRWRTDRFTGRTTPRDTFDAIGRH